MGTAAAYYLPLPRVARALELLRSGEPVPRGFLGCAFVHKPLSEARRLGLRPETESEVWQLYKAREENGGLQGAAAGVLVVKSVIPKVLRAGIALIMTSANLLKGQSTIPTS